MPDWVIYIFYHSVGEVYFQSLSPNPTVVTFLQPVSLTFLVAQNSDGISNSITSLTVVGVNINGLLALLETNRLEASSQIFTLDLGDATVETAGNYTARKYADLLS